MKIPKTFIPERDLEGSVNNLLEEKNSTVEQEKVCEKSLQAFITRVELRKIPSSYSSNKIYVEVADCLRINFEGGENLYACITVPVRGVCEKRTTTYELKGVQEKADSMACKAAKKLKKLEKHLDLVKLTDKVNNDSELLEGLCEFFKKYSLEGGFEIEFQHGGSHILKRRRNPSVTEAYLALYGLYDKHLSKYVLKDKGKGFLYSLITGVKNLFRKN